MPLCYSTSHLSIRNRIDRCSLPFDVRARAFSRNVTFFQNAKNKHRLSVDDTNVVFYSMSDSVNNSVYLSYVENEILIAAINKCSTTRNGNGESFV